ncbi:hypothetical protein STENM36S_00835 [Streptomyces tendae]
MEVVVVLPWVPATAIGRRPFIRAARASERCTTGMPSSAARASSGLSSRIAEETTTQLASSARCSAACPMCTVAPRARSASAVADSLASLPATAAPRWARILAMPDIPAPPMPMKCGRSMAVGRPGAMRCSPRVIRRWARPLGGGAAPAYALLCEKSFRTGTPTLCRAREAQSRWKNSST